TTLTTNTAVATSGAHGELSSCAAMGVITTLATTAATTSHMASRTGATRYRRHHPRSAAAADFGVPPARVQIVQSAVSRAEKGTSIAPHKRTAGLAIRSSTFTLLPRSFL